MAKNVRAELGADGKHSSKAGSGKPHAFKTQQKQQKSHTRAGNQALDVPDQGQQQMGARTQPRQQQPSGGPQPPQTHKPAGQQPAQATSEPVNYNSEPAVPAAEQPTSRLCVKNLPKYTTEDALKKMFSVKGEVTDIKIIRTRDGVSRQMGFVGFKSESDAAAALKYYNNTYIDAMKISVEYARGFKDPALARPWSKHSEGSSARAKALQAAGLPTGQSRDVDGSAAEAQALAHKLKLRAGKQGPVDALAANDPKLAEFLALMAPRSRAKLWANDEVNPTQTLDDILAGGKDPMALTDTHDGASSDDDEYQDLPTTVDGDSKKRLDRYRAVGTGSDGSDSDGQSDGERSEEGHGSEGDEDEPAAAVTKDAMVVSEAVSDLDYLRSRMRKWTDDDTHMDDNTHNDNTHDDKIDNTHDMAHARKEDSEAHKRQDMDLDACETEKGAGGAEEAAAANPNPTLNPNANPNPSSSHGHNNDLVVDAEAAVRATSRLFLRNLGYGVTETDLLELGGKYGDVSHVHLVIDRETKKSKGLAYIQYTTADAAVDAYRALDGIIFQGRLLHVLPAKAPSSAVVAVEEAGEGARHAAGSSYKAQKEEKRKADAGNRAAWNALFMRADTVQEAVAAHYGLSKSELLDARTTGDLAVRVALGEAAVIQQTKVALAEQGVNIASLEAAAAAGGSAAASKSNVARSPTTLLVKNIPFSTTEEALSELFGRCGPLARVVLPPSHTLALVEYCEPQDARTAFKTLAYKRFQHVPLYLEWAPKDIFTSPATGTVQRPAEQPAAAATAAAAGQAVAAAAGTVGAGTADAGTAQAAFINEAAAAGGQDEDDTQSCAIYVKNLAFATTDASLKKHFEKVVTEAGGVLHSARVSRRKHPVSGELLSAGFGFVEVDSPDVAVAVIAKLQNSRLDHHQLSLQLSRRKASTDTTTGTATGKTAGTKRTASAAGTGTGDSAAGADKGGAGSGAGTKGQGGTKLVVRNVAFEATRKDLVGLFSPFGHLKSCRLPKKFDGNHRGFGFVEFVTKQEARNALEGVTGTHLYGRRLVVEYAKEDGGLDELRAKTAAKYRDEDEAVLAAPAQPKAKKAKRS